MDEDRNADVRHVFPGDLEEMAAYDPNVDIDAYADALRGTLIYESWAYRRAFTVFFFAVFPFLHRFFPGVSLNKDWR